jgi:nicotinamide-nucleotide amidase
MFSLEIVTLARLLVDEARERSLRIVTAESCTGGLVAGAICQVSGIPGDLIADLGAVSEPVARMMAEGALENSNAHIAVAITGVAGPGGGTPMKPVGTVHIATARTNHGLMHRQEFFELEDREGIQLAAVQSALQMLRDRVT